MPVTPAYEWSQTDEEVVIDVQIKGITKQRMDVFATDAMVKVVAHPYVLILDLLEDVDADASTAYTQPGHVTFRMKKVLLLQFGINSAKYLYFPFCRGYKHALLLTGLAHSYWCNRRCNRRITLRVEES